MDNIDYINYINQPHDAITEVKPTPTVPRITQVYLGDAHVLFTFKNRSSSLLFHTTHGV